MNKSRRMVALQARALAAVGGTVAVLDPRGTGDSGGEHAAASWDGWLADAVAAWHWLVARGDQPVALWGSRLGALLALELAARELVTPAALLLWQPVATGKVWFSQLLRVANAQQIVDQDAAGPTTKALREALAAGSAVEVAGYDLAPALVVPAERVDAAALPVPSCPIVLREVATGEPPRLSPVAERLVRRWSATNPCVDAEAVIGPPFWSSLEISEAPELITASTGPLSRLLEGEPPSA